MAAQNLTLALPGTQVCTFAQLYDDASKDPFKRNYERIMERFDPDRNDAVRSDVLFQQAVSLGGTTLRAYLCCGITLNVPKIYCVHMPTKFVAAMDGTATPWDDHSFAFLGDLVRVAYHHRYVSGRRLRQNNDSNQNLGLHGSASGRAHRCAVLSYGDTTR